jgi:hypothetical protein
MLFKVVLDIYRPYIVKIVWWTPHSPEDHNRKSYEAWHIFPGWLHNGLENLNIL